jgi:aminopeptidase N
MNRHFRLCLLAGGLASLFGQQPGGDPEYRKLRDAQLSEAFVVENVGLRRDVGDITLKSGTISFAPPILNRVTLGVFSGEGEFELTPAVAYERDYLKSLIGMGTVKETFDRAVFFFTDGSFAAARAGRAQAVTPAAADFFKDFRQRIRTLYEGENIEAVILADLYNPRAPGFFTAFLHGNKYSDLRFAVRPRGAIPELPPEEVTLVNAESGSDTAGIWYLAHRAGEYSDGRVRSSEDKRTIAAESYRIETTIGRNERITAKAGLTFRAVTAGDRVIRFELLPALRVSSVRTGSTPVSFIQEDRKKDGSFYAVMPEPMVKDRTYQLTIEYAGDKVVRNEGGGNFSVGARESWYPSVNAFADQAKYDLTFKVPRQYTLVSVGKLEGETREGDLTVSHWVSDVPIAVAGFNYGQYKKQEIKFDAFPYAVEGFATTGLPDYLKGAEEIGGMSPSRLTDQALNETKVALQIYDKYFGRPPYGRIALTQQPDPDFGQSWPGLVYLPLISFLDQTQRWQLFGEVRRGVTDFIQEVTPHEVAHQWWGHMVGWNSYRDQWLSEGFADFSAGLFLQLTQPKPDKALRFWEQARDRILEKNRFGRSANEAGPLYMGTRLSSPKNPGAYNSLVYPKGGYVVHMLQSLMWDPQKGDAAFIAMMRDFVQIHLFKHASSESFQAVVEKHMTPAMNLAGNGKMDWFFDQWVYGTDVPRYKFDYELVPGQDGKVRLKATLAQSGVGEKFVMGVPLYGDFDGRQIRIGSVRIVGNTTSNIDVLLPQKPRKVAINSNFDVLAQK